MRGRPKDGRIDEDVVVAVLNMLKAKGYRHVTIERVAKTVHRAAPVFTAAGRASANWSLYAVLSTFELGAGRRQRLDS